MNRRWAHAAVTGDVDALEEIIGRGGNVDALDRYGQTALMLAAHRGDLAMVELLVDSGSDLNVTAKHGLSALMLAVIGGHIEVALALARAGADLSLRGSGPPGFAGKTAYDLAVGRGLEELYTALEIL